MVKWIRIVATIAVVYIHASRFDLYDERWKTEDGTLFIDTYLRFGRTLTHRSIHFDNIWTSVPMK